MRIVRVGNGVLAAIIAVAILFPTPRAVAGAPQEVQAVLAAKSLPTRIDVVGVVSRRNPAKGTFALIDCAEYAHCKTVTCSSASLPVQWKGALPAIEKTVRVKGAVRDTGEGKFLFAESVEAVGK